MAHILHAENELREIETEIKDELGAVTKGKATKSFVKTVTFMLDKATPHTLSFLPLGYELKAGDDVKYVVGDAAHVYHEFTDAADAVQAYLDGKV